MDLIALAGPSTKIPIDGTTFVSHVLPPVICYFLLAVLAITSHTQAVRFALWLFMVLLASRASLSMDMSNGKSEYAFSNTTFVLFMVACTTRSLGWTLERGPLVRRLCPGNNTPSIIMDALDLASTFRGHGWEWSRRLYIPRETRPTHRIAFALYAFFSAVAHALLCGIFHTAVLSLVPGGVDTIRGGSTLFDDSLPLLVQYLRASIITTSIAFVIYAGMQMLYDVCTVFGVLVLRQEPAQWPPAFDAPWRATSLNDFWSRRWHQFLRHMLLVAGGHPLSLVLGRTGIVIGTFLASALWHHVNLLTHDSEAEFQWMLVGFGMMAPGVLAEHAFYRWTGRPVCGVVGWVWTMGWLVLWGNVIFEGFARAPMHDRSSLIDGLPLVRTWVEGFVTGLDDWLHAI